MLALHQNPIIVTIESQRIAPYSTVYGIKNAGSFPGQVILTVVGCIDKPVAHRPSIGFGDNDLIYGYHVVDPAGSFAARNCRLRGFRFGSRLASLGGVGRLQVNIDLLRADGATGALGEDVTGIARTAFDVHVSQFVGGHVDWSELAILPLLYEQTRDRLGCVSVRDDGAVLLVEIDQGSPYHVGSLPQSHVARVVSDTRLIA